MATSCETSANAHLIAASVFRLQAAVLARSDVENAAKLVFCSLLCDLGFRQGWLLTKPVARFTADLSLASEDDLHRHIQSLAAAKILTMKPEGELLGVGFGPWSVLQLRAE